MKTLFPNKNYATLMLDRVTEVCELMGEVKITLAFYHQYI